MKLCEYIDLTISFKTVPKFAEIKDVQEWFQLTKRHDRHASILDMGTAADYANIRIFAEVLLRDNQKTLKRNESARGNAKDNC